MGRMVINREECFLGMLVPISIIVDDVVLDKIKNR